MGQVCHGVGRLGLSLWNCYKYDNKEVTAWLKLTTARGPTYIVNEVYSASALLLLGRLLTPCGSNLADLGFISVQLSSVLTIQKITEAVIVFMAAPYFGTLADSNNNRKTLLIVTNLGWVSAIFLGAIALFFTPSLTIFWLFFFAMISRGIFYEVALFLAFAYLPEIITTEAQLTRITSYQYAIVNMLQLLCAATLMVIAKAIPAGTFKNELPITIIAHFFALAVWAYLGIPGLWQIPNRHHPVVHKSKASREVSSHNLDATNFAISNNSSAMLDDDVNSNSVQAQEKIDPLTIQPSLSAEVSPHDTVSMFEENFHSGMLAEESLTDDNKKLGCLSVWKRVFLVMVDLKRNYPQAGWFLISYCLHHSATDVMTALTIAYVTAELGFQATEIGVIGALLLVFGVAGALSVDKLCKLFPRKKILMCALVGWILLCTCGPYLAIGREIPFTDSDYSLNDTDTGGYEYEYSNCHLAAGKDEVVINREPTPLGSVVIYFFAIAMGFMLGVTYPLDSSIFSLLIPGGQEASFLGLKTFLQCGSIWLAPFFFTIINESTENLQFAFAFTSVWFALSIPFLYYLDIDKGMKDVKHTLHRRQGVGKHFKNNRQLEHESLNPSTLNL